MITSIHQLSPETQKLFDLDVYKELIRHERDLKILGYASMISLFLPMIALVLIFNFKDLNGTYYMVGIMLIISIISAKKRECELKLDIIKILIDNISSESAIKKL